MRVSKVNTRNNLSKITENLIFVIRNINEYWKFINKRLLDLLCHLSKITSDIYLNLVGITRIFSVIYFFPNLEQILHLCIICVRTFRELWTTLLSKSYLCQLSFFRSEIVWQSRWYSMHWEVEVTPAEKYNLDLRLYFTTRILPLPIH